MTLTTWNVNLFIETCAYNSNQNFPHFFLFIVQGKYKRIKETTPSIPFYFSFKINV